MAATKAPRVGSKIMVLLGPKWLHDDAPGKVVAYDGKWDGVPAVSVEFTLTTPAPEPTDEQLADPDYEQPEPTVTTYQVDDVFLFDTKADAAKWLKAGHQSVGAHREAK